MKSGILLLMDSKHHKKFIRKRRVVKVSEKGLRGRAGGERKNGGGAGVFVYAEYSNDDEPVPSCALFFFFLISCSELFIRSGAQLPRSSRAAAAADANGHETLALRGRVHSPGRR